MSDAQELLDLAERCEKAEADATHDLLLEAHLLSRGLNRYVQPGFKTLLSSGGWTDCAQALVPTGLDWELDWIGERSAARLLAARGTFVGSGTSPALALCAAALRSLASSGDQS